MMKDIFDVEIPLLGTHHFQATHLGLESQDSFAHLLLCQHDISQVQVPKC